MAQKYEDDKVYLEFGGQTIYIDFDELFRSVLFVNDSVAKPDINKTLKEESPVSDQIKTNPETYSIHVTKWDIINKLIDVLVLSNNEERDSKLGQKNLDGLPIGFKIAYNTLVLNNIIKTID